MVKYIYNLFILIVFVYGLYYYTYNKKHIENMENIDTNKENIDANKEQICHNMLIEHDGKIYLFNNKLPIEEDKNPLIFDNLEEYKEFVQLQDLNNKKCPVLFLQYTTNTQNEELLQVKSSIFENNGGYQINPKDDRYYNKHRILDATKNSTPIDDNIFNKNMYSGFDKHNQNIGRDTPLDRIFDSNSKTSPNAMDNNWGGKKYTQNKIDKGEYDDRKVYKYKNTINMDNNITQII